MADASSKPGWTSSRTTPTCWCASPRSPTCTAATSPPASGSRNERRRPSSRTSSRPGTSPRQGGPPQPLPGPSRGTVAPPAGVRPDRRRAPDHPRCASGRPAEPAPADRDDRVGAALQPAELATPDAPSTRLRTIGLPMLRGWSAGGDGTLGQVLDAVRAWSTRWSARRVARGAPSPGDPRAPRPHRRPRRGPDAPRQRRDPIAHPESLARRR